MRSLARPPAATATIISPAALPYHAGLASSGAQASNARRQAATLAAVAGRLVSVPAPAGPRTAPPPAPNQPPPRVSGAPHTQAGGNGPGGRRPRPHVLSARP